MRRFILSKSIRSGFRPAVRAELVLEVKHFAAGFDRQQLGVHAKQAMDDVLKLCELSEVCPEGRGVVLFDEIGFLRGGDREKIVAKRNTGDPALRLYLFEPDGQGKLGWRRL